VSDTEITTRTANNSGAGTATWTITYPRCADNDQNSAELTVAMTIADEPTLSAVVPPASLLGSLAQLNQRAGAYQGSETGGVRFIR